MNSNGRSMLEPLRGVLLTICALGAFASNSILCRLALGASEIDPYSFTAVRLGSGALILVLLRAIGERERASAPTRRRGAVLLVGYALPFSLAYVRLDTGTGALLLFATVQVAMVGLAIGSGERPVTLEWLGLVGALAGTAYLVSPGLSAPDPIGAAFMVVAGLGWAGYSTVGRGFADPTSETAVNFGRAALWIVPLTLLGSPWLEVSARGLVIALLSGAFASGLGYIVWYGALNYLTVTRAALVQLAVPILAAGGGVVFVDETITRRLVIATAITLGSIGVGTLGRSRR